MYLCRCIFRREKASKYRFSFLNPDTPLLFVVSHRVGHLSFTLNYSSVPYSDSHGSHYPEKAKSAWRNPPGEDFSVTKAPAQEQRVDLSEPENYLKARENLIKSLARKIVSNVVSSEKLSQDCIRARYQYQCLRNKQDWKPDWRDIRNFLIQTTPTHGHRIENGARITIPAISIQRFLCGVDDSVFEIGNSYDCTVELASPENRHIYSNFILSGSEIAIYNTIVHVKKLEPNIMLKHSEPAKNLIRYVQSHSQRPILLAHLVPQPTSWTTMNLLDYVNDLTAYVPNYHELRFHPFSSEKITTHYYMIVMQRIRQLLADPLAQKVFSRAALHKAMTYFCKQNRMDLVRELFTSFGFLKLYSTPETYNILLWASAENEDFHNFLFILNMMIEANLIPNGMTWVAFLKAVPSHEIKLRIYENIKEKGLLSNTRTLQRVVDQFIEIDLQRCLFYKYDNETFIKKMDERYGPKWLSIEAANRVLAILGRYCQTYRTFEFLAYMESQLKYPDTYSINTILFFCYQKPAPWKAIVELMSVSKFRDLLKPGKETCRILFRLAWKTKSFNMAKLVWRYACLSASTSTSARKQINRSLRLGLTLSGDSLGMEWNTAAGFVILGSLSTPHPMENVPRTTPRSLNSSEPLLPPSHRINLPECFAKRIDLDLEISQEWRPTKNFGSMLWQAIERDVKWRKNHFHHQRSLTWLIENSVPLQISDKLDRHDCLVWN